MRFHSYLMIQVKNENAKKISCYSIYEDSTRFARLIGKIFVVIFFIDLNSRRLYQHAILWLLEHHETELWGFILRIKQTIERIFNGGSH